MTDRYEAVAARKYEANGEERTAFTNIGVAFKMRDRDGYSLRLHAIPAPVNGEYSILLFPPKPREDRQQGGGQSRQESVRRDRDDPRTQQGGGSYATDLDDEIPF